MHFHAACELVDFQVVALYLEQLDVYSIMFLVSLVNNVFTQKMYMRAHV